MLVFQSGGSGMVNFIPVGIDWIVHFGRNGMYRFNSM